MAKMTVLQMVQDILSDMESDEVNSVSDTVEAEGIAKLLKSTYFELVLNRVIPENKALVQLVALGDTAKPNYLKYPDNLLKGELFKYDKHQASETRKRFIEVKYRDPVDFLDLVNIRDTTETNIIQVTDFNGVTLSIRNDRAPEYWTSFDDLHVVCDSYDAAVDTTLQSSKTQMWGSLESVFVETDNDFIPQMDSNYFPYLLAQTKTKAFDLYKQTIPPTVARSARKQEISVQANKHRFDLIDDVPDYGRKN